MKTGTGFVFQSITAERNEELLKMCIQMATALKAQGDAPFAALLADENGNILMVQDTLVCILNIMLESRILALVQRSRPSISLIQWRHKKLACRCRSQIIIVKLSITILMVLKERLHIERLLITGSYPFPSRQVWHSTGKAGNVK